MKAPVQTMPGTRRALAAAIALTALGAPAVRAQTAEEFQQLKAMVEQMQQTIQAQNARIAELERVKGAPAPVPAPAPPPAPAAVMPGVTAETSPSMRTIEKVAGGEPVGQQSPVTYRGTLNDQQEAAS